MLRRNDRIWCKGLTCKASSVSSKQTSWYNKKFSPTGFFRDWKLQTETPALRNLGRNKRLLWKLSDELNTFHRNQTIYHTNSITYFNSLFLKTAIQTIRRGKIIHFCNAQKSEKSFAIYLYYLKHELVKASSLKSSISRPRLEPNPFWMRIWHTKGRKNKVFWKIKRK